MEKGTVIYRISPLCIGCGRCADVCPTGCIDTHSVPFVIDSGRCAGCGSCFSICPRGAVEREKK
ncbi:MAG: 4Fe-4S binding protein [Oscillospiraceae bacterium]|nr:4Fe-4S binding protein [Oscillospiraceae bacterium]